MYFSIIYSVALIAGIVSAAPASKRNDFSPDNVYYPLENGFPNPSEDATVGIEIAADGTLPDSPPPEKISPDGAISMKLIAFNELFEVAFFKEIIHNVTNKLPGYDLGYGHEYVMDALDAIVAQEQLHALNANAVLKNFDLAPIEPCKYLFPVTDFQSAMNLAATFTDVVLGTLQDVNQIFAKNGDDAFVRRISSVLGNEAEQEGFYRLVQKKRPAAQPFLTTSVRDFAFTAIQSFTIPGSCPNSNTIPLKTFKPLNVLTTDIKPQTQNLKFSFAKEDAGTEDWETLSLVYINAQNVPIMKELENVSVEDGTVTFEAAFPYDEFLMNGLTIAAVTNDVDKFDTADDVAKEAIFGPGLIEID